MKIDWSKSIETTSGLPAEYVRRIEGPDGLNHLVLISKSTRLRAHQFAIVVDDSGCGDIVNTKLKGEVWMTFVQGQTRAVSYFSWPTEEAARGLRPSVIAIVRVPWTDGDGL